MRTNYGALKRLLTKMYPDASIEKARGQGLVVVWADGDVTNPEPVDTRIRVVLADGNDYSNEIGIHLRRLEKSELWNALGDAFETAEKDMFPTVWIHMNPKPNPKMREARIKAVKSWIESGQKHVNTSYSINKLPFDPEACLETMNDDQLALVLALIADNYHKGANDTREFRKSLESNKGA